VTLAIAFALSKAAFVLVLDEAAAPNAVKAMSASKSFNTRHTKEKPRWARGLKKLGANVAHLHAPW
jgi:hypothetical protein